MEDVASLASSDQQQEIEIEGNIMRLDALSTRGRWCGWCEEWTDTDWTDSGMSIIKYDGMTEDTNMNVSPSPLNIDTGR